VKTTVNNGLVNPSQAASERIKAEREGKGVGALAGDASAEAAARMLERRASLELLEAEHKEKFMENAALFKDAVGDDSPPLVHGCALLDCCLSVA
jgi:hypothetical protein